MIFSAKQSRFLATRLAAVTVTTMIVVVPTGAAAAHPAAPAPHSSRTCPPAALPLNFSDSLDKLSYDDVELGGLSSLAYDRRSAAWVSSVDNHGIDPARLWFFRNLTDPTVVRDPLVLRRPDGTARDGITSDNEGLAVLPDGDFLVSSETEPSIRIYGRNGIQQASLPIPARFAVAGTTGQGQATFNATLEGLTISRDGREIVAAMEAALSGDVSPAGDATMHRFLVYRLDAHGSWILTKQIAYRTDPGNRVPEIAAYGRDSLLVEEAAYSTTAGNSVELYAVGNTDRAADVTDVDNLSLAPSGDVEGKQLVANLVSCPTLGATAKETQTNPLLDNYEGMAISSGGPGPALVSLISDDNFNANQTTRVLNLAAFLP